MPRRDAPASKIVDDAEEARANILRFAAEARDSDAFRARFGRVHAWYATRGEEGGWAFGSSKFVGYRDNDAERYLQAASTGVDGRETEAVLKHWFEVVAADSPLGRELSQALESFLGAWGMRPRRQVRIAVLASELDELRAGGRGSRLSAEALAARISSDPAICAGRPCIRGTRVRVSDIVSMMAAGASRQEIVADYPYLTEDDITAALAFAAAAVDHRVIRAA